MNYACVYIIHILSYRYPSNSMSVTFTKRVFVGEHYFEYDRAI